MGLDKKELEALVKLMDDSDPEVREIVNSKLAEAGVEIVPDLEKLWENFPEGEEAIKIEGLITDLYENYVAEELNNWFWNDSEDLFKMLVLITRIKYPSYDEGIALSYIEKLSTDAWVQLYASAHPTDKIQVLNHVFFDQYDLKGDSETYNHPDNSFISRLTETRKGNPITLSSLYIIVAHRLGLPVFGVNLPQHFVVAYCDPGLSEVNEYVKQNRILHRNQYGEVLFYINPFNKGKVFSRDNLESFLKTINVKPRDQFYQTCSNKEIYLRILRNLHYSMGEQDEIEKQQFIERLQNQCK